MPDVEGFVETACEGLAAIFLFLFVVFAFPLLLIGWVVGWCIRRR